MNIQMYQPREQFHLQERSALDLAGSTLSLERIIGILRRQWPVIAGVVGVAVAIGLVYLLTATPMYTANTRILMDTRQTQVLDKDNGTPSALIDPGFVDSQVEIITSDDLIRSVVRRMNLTADPEFNGSDPGLLPAIIGKVIGLFGSDGPASKERIERGTVAAVEGNLKVERLLTTYVLSASFRSRDPDKAAQIANEIADAYIVGALDAKYQSTKRASEWLQQRSAELREQATASDRAVQTFKSQNNIVGTSRGLMNEQQLTDVNTQLIQARAATSEAKARLDRIEAISDKDLAQPTVTDALNNPVITRLRAQYLDLQAQYSDWSARYGKTHQASVNLANRMEELRKSIADEVKRIGDAYRSDYEIAKSRETSLRGEPQEPGQPGRQHRTGAGEAARPRERGRHLPQPVQQLPREAAAGHAEPELPDQRIPHHQHRCEAGPQELPQDGALPDRRAVRWSLLRPGRRLCPGDAERRAALSDRGRGRDRRQMPRRASGHRRQGDGLAEGPRIAIVRWRPVEASGPLSRYVIDHPFSRYAETMRNIKVSIDLARLSREVKVIGIVSSLPKEGKTTVSANFAHLTAFTGKRVLLIDGDLHTRSLTKELDPTAKSGLLEALKNPQSVGHHIRRSAETGLDFLPSFAITRMVNSADIMASKAMADLLALLRNEYDYIVIDLAPVMPVTDAKAISHLIDAYVYVIEWGRTTRTALQELMSSSEGIQKKVLGAVLNGANPKMLKRIEGYKGSHYNAYYVEGA